MAHIEIPLPNERHITIVHIGPLKPAEAERIYRELTDSEYLFDWPKAEVILDKRKMFGRGKNIPVMTVRSKFVSEVRAWCCDLLGLLKIPYSKDWDYTPHITDPPDSWLYKATLEIVPVLRICYKDNTGEKKYKEIELRVY